MKKTVTFVNATKAEINLITEIVDRRISFNKFNSYSFKISENLALRHEESIISISLSSDVAEIEIEKADYAGVRYAINCLAKSIDCDESFSKRKFSPSFSIRGVIEGFYGTPWSHDQRKSGIEHFADFGMNHFMLAPKDDPWQRFEWRTPFEGKFMEGVADLVETGSKHSLQIAVSLSPGLTVVYSEPNDVDAILVRYRQLYEIGVRHFGLLVDDIPGHLQHSDDIAKFSDIAEAHAYYANSIYAKLAKLDSDSIFTVCPLVYHGRGTEPYIAKLGKLLNPAINLMWTGRQICSEYLDIFDAEMFYQQTSKQPFYWDNYPVNDAEMINELHVGPITGREKGLSKFSVGLLANPMDRFDLSLVSLGTVGDYLWDSENYDPESSWEYWLKYLIVDSDDRLAFRNLLRSSFGSCLANNASPEFGLMLDDAKFKWRTGRMAEGVKVLYSYADQMDADIARIMDDKFTMPVFRTQAMPWIIKYGLGSEAIRRIADILGTCKPSERGGLTGPVGSTEAIWEIWNSLNQNQARLFGNNFILILGELATEISVAKNK